MQKEDSVDATSTSARDFLVPGSDAAGSPACLVQIYGGELGKRVELSATDIVIGRGEQCDFGVDQSEVSRRHSRLFGLDGIVFVEDLGSTNGTFVNDEEITGRRALGNGDFIRCGGAVFKFIVGGNLEALYHEEIYRLTIIDGLTQVANKRCFIDFLEREVARASRHERPLSLAMLDLDHFKNVNDGYGHLAGDRVLKGVADLVRQRIRRDELLARYGGEEFVMVLPETPLDKALIFCKRLRESVEAEVFDFDGKTIRLTVSIGVAAMVLNEPSEMLIRRADTLLYRAKTEGRNRVVAG